MTENLGPHDPDGDLIIDDDDDAALAAPAPELAPWRILIVDDDVDVHVVTKFALSNTSFQGRRLSFLHAYSGKEAIAVLRETPDIALVLLDVIMETENAGLEIARRIRDELHNELVRIVLRTGQPGQALEHSIIVDYDIDDFWCKADLTTRKLFTTVISSLRAYATLSAAAAARTELQGQLAEAARLRATVDAHALVLTLDQGGIIVDANERFCSATGVAREQLVGHGLHAVHPAPFPQPLASQVVQAIERDGGWAGDIHITTVNGTALGLRCAVLAFKGNGGPGKHIVAVATVLDPPG